MRVVTCIFTQFVTGASHIPARTATIAAPLVGGDRRSFEGIVGELGVVDGGRHTGLVAGPADETRAPANVGAAVGVVGASRVGAARVGAIGVGAVAVVTGAVGVARTTPSVVIEAVGRGLVIGGARVPTPTGGPVVAAAGQLENHLDQIRLLRSARLTAERRHDGGELVAVFALELGTIELRIQAHSKPLG